MKSEASFQSSTRKHNFALRDFINLTKPTVTLLVVVTVVPSLLIASPAIPHPVLVICTILGTALASASAAVFNQIVEVDIDLAMKRTKRRSVPSGRISQSSAIIFAAILGFVAWCLLFYGANPLTAIIALSGHLFYVFVYTLYLKPRTPQNIVIGGAAGAVGPLIGWAAAKNELDFAAWLLFLIITLWTPPHFWALALKYKEDYAKAGIPMFPVVHGDHKTRLWMLIYTILLLPAVIGVAYFSSAGWIYLVISLAFTFKFVFDAFKIYIDGNNRYVMPFFHFSCLYTFVIFGALTLDWLIL